MTTQNIEIIEGPLAMKEGPADWDDGVFGSVILFRGVVRSRNHGRKVRAVSYEAFEPLAKKVLNEIRIEAAEKFRIDAEKIYIAHSTGEILPGQASLVVAVATVHRAEGFGASQYVIDELKSRVPIWKHELYEDGSSAWLRGCALHGDARQGHHGEHGS